MGQREAWLGDTQGKGKSHYCPCLRQQDGPPWGWAVWQEGDGTASMGSPTPSGVGLGEAVGWHVSLWDRCPYKKRRGHQRRVALRVRPRDRTGVRRQRREAWPGPALLTARCGPPPLELRPPAVMFCQATLANKANTPSCPWPSTQCGSKNVTPAPLAPEAQSTVTAGAR